MKGASPRAGFSLVEFMVSAAVGAAVIYGIWTVTSLIGADAGRQDRQVMVARKLMGVYEHLQHDLRRAAGFVRDGEGYRLSVRVRGAGGKPELQDVLWITEGDALVRTEAGGAAQRFDLTEELGPGKRPRLVIREVIGPDGRRRLIYELVFGEGGEDEYRFASDLEPEGTDLDPSRAVSDALDPELAALARGVVVAPTSPAVAAAPAEAEVQGVAIPKRPAQSLAGMWIQFVAGGDEEAIAADRGLFRGRTSIEGVNGPPVIFRTGDPLDQEDGPSPRPPARGSPEYDGLVGASSDTEGYVVATVPGGLLGAPVLSVASPRMQGAAGNSREPGEPSYPVPLAEGRPGGMATASTWGTGDPGGVLPGDRTPIPGLPETPGALEPPGASPGAPAPAGPAVDTANEPTPGDVILIDDIATSADEVGTVLIDPRDFPPSPIDRGQPGMGPTGGGGGGNNSGFLDFLVAVCILFDCAGTQGTQTGGTSTMGGTSTSSTYGGRRRRGRHRDGSHTSGDSTSTGGDSTSTGGDSTSTGGDSTSTGGDSTSTGGDSTSTGGDRGGRRGGDRGGRRGGRR